MSEEYPPTMSLAALRIAVPAVFRYAGFTVEPVDRESSSIIDFVTYPNSGGGDSPRHCVACVDDSKDFGEKQIDEISEESKRLGYNIVEVISSRQFEPAIVELAKAKGISLTDGEKFRGVLQGLSGDSSKVSSPETRKVTSLPPARIVSRSMSSDGASATQSEIPGKTKPEEPFPALEVSDVEPQSASPTKSIPVNLEDAESAFTEFKSLGSRTDDPAPVDAKSELVGKDEPDGLTGDIGESAKVVEDETLSTVATAPDGKPHPPRWELSPVKAATIEFDSVTTGQEGSPEEEFPSFEISEETIADTTEPLPNEVHVDLNGGESPGSQTLPGEDSAETESHTVGLEKESVIGIKDSSIVDPAESPEGEEEEARRDQNDIPQIREEKGEEEHSANLEDKIALEGRGTSPPLLFSTADEDTEDSFETPPPFPVSLEEEELAAPETVDLQIRQEGENKTAPFTPPGAPKKANRSKSKMVALLLAVCGVALFSLYKNEALSESIIEKFNAYSKAIGAETAGLVENLPTLSEFSNSSSKDSPTDEVETIEVPLELVALSIPDDAMVSSDLHKSSRSFLKKVWGVDSSNEPSFLNFFNKLSMNVTEGRPIDLEEPLIASVIVRLENRPESHPGLAAARILYLLEGKEALDEFSKVINHVSEPVLRFQLYCKMAAYTYSKDDIRMSISSLQAMLDETDGMASIGDSICVELLLEGPAAAVMEEAHETWATVIDGNEKARPWLKNLVVGRHHLLTALQGNDVEEHYKLAADALKQSWEANPRVPAAAAMAIEVSKSKSLEEARLWFDRAIASRADYLPAYLNYMDCLSQPSMGSDAHVEAFGRSCLGTGRFETEIPEQILNAHYNRAEAAGSKRAYWANLSVDEKTDLSEFFAGEENTRTDAVEVADFRSRQAAVWYLCGEMKKMASALSSDQFEIAQASLQNLPVSRVEILNAADDYAKREPEPIEEEEKVIPAIVVTTEQDEPESREEEPVLISTSVIPKMAADFTNDLENAMIWVSAGKFKRTTSGASSVPLDQEISISQGFWLADTEVTRGQWKKVMSDARAEAIQDRLDYPVDSVTWKEAKEFCRALSAQNRDRLPEGWRYDLPTEVQWDYAADRGEKVFYDESIAWTEKNSKNFLRAAGSKAPNKWGFYDLIGNAAEWVQDHYAVYENDFPLQDTVIELAEDSAHRSVRGGSVASYDRKFGINHRGHHDPSVGRPFLGFRIALVASEDGSPSSNFRGLTSADLAEEEDEEPAQ